MCGLNFYGSDVSTCSEDITTSVTSGCELSIVAWPTVDPIGLGPKLLVN